VAIQHVACKQRTLLDGGMWIARGTPSKALPRMKDLAARGSLMAQLWECDWEDDDDDERTAAGIRGDAPEQQGLAPRRDSHIEQPRSRPFQGEFGGADTLNHAGPIRAAEGDVATNSRKERDGGLRW
jgi:hypothetical protein